MSAPPRVEILSDADALVQRAAEHIVKAAKAAIQTKGRFDWALSGGSTPRTIYELLATPVYAGQIEWSHAHVFWGDERCVPPNHAESNYRMAWEALLSRVAIPLENTHRMHGELPPEEAARDYVELLEIEFGKTFPRFDLVLLGLGTDGHTASLFPGSTALGVEGKSVAANYLADSDTWRLTLTFPVINASRQVIFLVSGVSKAGIVSRVLDKDNAELLPAARVKPTNGDLLWLLDKAAAAHLSLQN